MSIHHLERAGELRMNPPTKKLVFMAFCDDADKTTGLAMPGLDKVMRWACCGKSQAQEHLSALISEGYIERIQAGRRGRRAVYRVFSTVPCCVEHAETLGSGLPEASSVDIPVDKSVVKKKASGQPDANSEIASGLRPVSVRSGPDALPSSHPPRGGDSRTEPHQEHAHRCPTHLDQEYPPNCWACKEAREAADAASAAQRAERERQATQERLERERAERQRMEAEADTPEAQAAREKAMNVVRSLRR